MSGGAGRSLTDGTRFLREAEARPSDELVPRSEDGSTLHNWLPAIAAANAVGCR